MHVHRLARGLHHEHVGPAHVLLDLHIRFAVVETRDQSLAARQAEKQANLIAERLVGGSAEDLKSVVDPGALWLAFRFFVRGRLLFRGQFFRGRRRNCAHSLSSQCSVASYQFSIPVLSLEIQCFYWQLTTGGWQLLFLAGPLGFEPRQSAPKALDLPLVDGPVKRSDWLIALQLSSNHCRLTTESCDGATGVLARPL